MNPDTELAIINGLLRKFDPCLSARFNPAEDESVDSEFEILRDGAPYRFDFAGDLSSLSIQCCLIGGGYCLNRHIYEEGDLAAVAWHYDGNNLRAATHAAVGLLIEAGAGQ